MAKRTRLTVRGGRKRAFKTPQAYKAHVREQVKADLCHDASGSWGVRHAKTSMCRDSRGGMKATA